MPSLSPTPGVKSIKTTSGGGISVSQATHALSPWFPTKSIHCLSTEELTAHPIKSLNAILKFLGQPANGSALLFKGSLPLTNPAGSKGRRDIEPPQWTAELKKRTLEIILPDSEAFLKTLHWPNNTWQWD